MTTIDITDGVKKRAVRDAIEPDISIAYGKCIGSSETLPAATAAEIVATAKESNSGNAATQPVGNGKPRQDAACVDPAVATLEVVDGAEAAAARRARRDAKRRAAAAAQAAEGLESVVLLE